MYSEREKDVYNNILDVCWDLLDDNTPPTEVIDYLDSRKKELSDPKLVQYLITLKFTLEEILMS